MSAAAERIGRLRRLVFLSVCLVCAGCKPDRDYGAASFAPEPLGSPAAVGSGESHLAVASDGTVVMSWLEPDGEGHALRFSTLQSAGWSPPRTVTRGEKWFVNWADFPSVVPISGRLWAAHWLARRPEGGYAYDVAMSLSADGGATWGSPIAPHTDGTPTEHGFVTLFPWQGGVGVVWLDGRNMLAGAGGTEGGHGHGEGGMTLRSASVSADGTLTHELLIDELTCDCCQTDVAIGPDGPIVVYRDRSEGEIRDIFVARAQEGVWSAPAAVSDDGWRIEGCPVNGPAIDARGAEVVVAWFTAADDEPRIRVARSTDGAGSFAPAVDLDVSSPLGRVDAVLLEGGDAIVSWLAADEAGAAVVLRRVGRDGRLGPVRIVGRTAASRPSGFPQMVAAGGQLVISWTEVSEEEARVATARLPAQATK